jgi:hypothetical protein
MVYKIISIHGDLLKKTTELSYIHLEENGGIWSFQLLADKKIEISFRSSIPGILQMPVSEFVTADKEVSAKLAIEIMKFSEEKTLEHQIDFIAFSGIRINDAVFFGNPAVLAAKTMLPVVAEFHKMNDALEGSPNIYAIATGLLNADPVFTAENKNIAIALLAALRWREAYNILQKDTNAARDHIAGSIWLGVEA